MTIKIVTIVRPGGGFSEQQISVQSETGWLQLPSSVDYTRIRFPHVDSETTFSNTPCKGCFNPYCVPRQSND